MGTVEATARAFAGSGLARSVVEKDRCEAKSRRARKDRTRNKGSVEKATLVIQPRAAQGHSPHVTVDTGRSLPYILL